MSALRSWAAVLLLALVVGLAVAWATPAPQPDRPRTAAGAMWRPGR